MLVRRLRFPQGYLPNKLFVTPELRGPVVTWAHSSLTISSWVPQNSVLGP